MYLCDPQTLTLSQPDLDPNAFSRFMVRVDRAGEQQKKSMQRMTSKMFIDKMFTDEERFRHQELTAETVAGLTLEQVPPPCPRRLVHLVVVVWGFVFLTLTHTLSLTTTRCKRRWRAS